ncbi:L-2-amino-thiazoline-4-carboxylic acid hydrolase [Candidatus Bipolaricaulota bacterium]|nr:L-2-amino-thiazoline-4-carboxylic acid hydrolase [Candidatus Bipolaricaulota bacterium]
MNVGIEAEPLAAGDIDRYVRKIFARPVRGFGTEQAVTFLRSKPPFAFVDEAVPTTQGVLSLTTYQALHLCRDALVRIAEEAISRFGQAGELMLYDALLSDPEPSSVLSADEFMQQRLNRYQNPPNVADAFSAGLDIELLRGDEREIVAHVTQCEWARYYLELHPSVGYLLACSTDDPFYRQQCADVRFQRRCTLMEGGSYCEFDFYRL